MNREREDHYNAVRGRIDNEHHRLPGPCKREGRRGARSDKKQMLTKSFGPAEADSRKQGGKKVARLEGIERKELSSYSHIQGALSRKTYQSGGGDLN